jgi:hypothetical protein
MSICSQFVEEVLVGKDETTTKTSASACHSMMSVETQREGGKTWLILYPLKGNLKGHTMVSIEKETVQCGSNVAADLRFRDPKIKPLQATITRGPYDEKDGRTAYLQVPGSNTLVRFSHNETIFIYKDGNGSIPVCEHC